MGSAHCDVWLHDKALKAKGIISCYSTAHSLTHPFWNISSPGDDVQFNYGYTGHQSKLMLFLFYTAIHTSCLCHSWTSQRDLKGASQNLGASKWAKKPGESLNNWYSLIFKPEHVTSCCHLIIFSQRRHHSFVATVNILGLFLRWNLGKLSLVARTLKSVLYRSSDKYCAQPSSPDSGLRQRSSLPW